MYESQANLVPGAAYTSIGLLSNPSMLEVIRDKIASARKSLAELEELQELLERNPDSERILTLMGRKFF